MRLEHSLGFLCSLDMEHACWVSREYMVDLWNRGPVVKSSLNNIKPTRNCYWYVYMVSEVGSRNELRRRISFTPLIRCKSVKTTRKDTHSIETWPPSKSPKDLLWTGLWVNGCETVVRIIVFWTDSEIRRANWMQIPTLLLKWKGPGIVQ